MERISEELVYDSNNCSAEGHIRLVQNLLSFCQAQSPKKQVRKCVKDFTTSSKEICACHEAARKILTQTDKDSMTKEFMAFSLAISNATMERQKLHNGVKNMMISDINQLFHHQAMLAIVEDALEANKDFTLFFDVTGLMAENSKYSILEVFSNVEHREVNIDIDEFGIVFYGKEIDTLSLSASTINELKAKLYQVFSNIHKLRITKKTAHYNRLIMHSGDFDNVKIISLQKKV